MTETSGNAKKQRTSRHIREVLIKSLKTQPLEQITVKKLCEEAGINRGTFYKHYCDIYELYECIEHDYYVSLTIEAGELDPENFSSIVKRLLHTIKENSDLGSIIARNLNHSTFVKSCILYYKSYFIDMWEQNDAALTDIQVEYYFTGFVGWAAQVILFWIQRDTAESIEEICALIMKFSRFSGCLTG